jgi:hypothetical protein
MTISSRSDRDAQRHAQPHAPVDARLDAQILVQALFLTGQSDPTSCALSPVQQAFLDALPLPASARLSLNFPYRTDTPPWRHTPVLVGSVNNARQYARSRRPEFAAEYAPHVQRLIVRARRTLILAGSCGLELLANLHLPREALDTVHVFAYGPTARRRPDCACVLVQGRRDWISRCWFRADTVDHRVDCFHRDYLQSPEVLRLCIEMVRKLEREAEAEAEAEADAEVEAEGKRQGERELDHPNGIAS